MRKLYLKRPHPWHRNSVRQSVPCSTSCWVDVS
jgi:hypothetical protein